MLLKIIWLYIREFLSREESYNKKSAILSFTTKPKWQLRKEKEEKKKKEIPSEVIERHCGFSSPHFLLLKTRTRSKRNPSSHFLLRFCQWRAEFCTVQWDCLILKEVTLILTWIFFFVFVSFQGLTHVSCNFEIFLKFYSALGLK